jgi:hypothetical protein
LTDSFGEATTLTETVDTQIDLAGHDRPWVFVVAVDDADLESVPSSPMAVADVPVALQRVELSPAVPNPFNPRTTLRFALPQDTHTRLSVYDVKGRLVQVLVNEAMTFGDGMRWFGKDVDSSGRQVAAGTYFSRLEAAGKVLTRRMLLLK